MAKNTIGQLIADSITISRASGLPILLMGNPGTGKTTHVRKWAKANGYELEILIGSRNTPEEILGYQVNNGGTALTHLNPSWWNRVQENAKKGKPTLVFVDELSVCPEVVQGSLLSLVADRENSEGEKLPEDCLIVSAANYARNLPSMMNILTPTLNRFVIVNILEGRNNLEILEEFLTEQKPIEQHNYNALSADIARKIDSDVLDFFNKLLGIYSDRKGSRGFLDFSNTDLGNIYQNSDGNVYNLMTPRTCFYLQKIVKTVVACGVLSKDEIYAWANGLIGYGTNNFPDNQQWEKFRRTVCASIYSICAKYINLQSGKDVVKISSSALTLSDKINEFLMHREGAEDLTDATAGRLVDVFIDAASKYGDVVEVAKSMENGVTQLDAAEYCSDMEALQKLLMFFKETGEQSSEIEKLVKIHQDNFFLYRSLIGESCDFVTMKDVYGESTPDRINRIVVLKLRNKALEQTEYRKAGIRATGNNVMFYLMEKDQAASDVSISTNLNKDLIEKTIVPKIKTA